MIKPHGSSLLSFLCDSSWKAAIAETGIIASYSRSSLFFHESSAEHILSFIISRLSEDVENVTCFFAELQTLLSWSLYCLLLPTEQCLSFFLSVLCLFFSFCSSCASFSSSWTAETLYYYTSWHFWYSLIKKKQNKTHNPSKILKR